MANFCRSPVAEKLLSKIYKQYEFASTGLRPLETASMDKRSRKFLESKGIDDIFHTPTKINSHMMQNSNLILAMDVHILGMLNRKFRNYKNKIFLFSYGEALSDMSDPFRASEEDYKRIMENIFVLTKNFEERFKNKI